MAVKHKMLNISHNEKKYRKNDEISFSASHTGNI